MSRDLLDRRPLLIGAAAGAHGQQVFNQTPSFAVRSPVVGIATARLTVFFTAGDVAGEYVLRFRLFGKFPRDARPGRVISAARTE